MVQQRQFQCRVGGACPIESLANDWFKAIDAKDLENTSSFDLSSDAQFIGGQCPRRVTPDLERSRTPLGRGSCDSPGFPCASQEATSKFESAPSRAELAYQSGTYVAGRPTEKAISHVLTGEFSGRLEKQTSGEWKAIIDIHKCRCAVTKRLIKVSPGRYGVSFHDPCVVECPVCLHLKSVLLRYK